VARCGPLAVFLATHLFNFFALTSATEYHVYYLYGKRLEERELANFDASLGA
jgi:hypothetical protein